MQRKASAVWHGSGKEGSGTVESQSGALHSHPYSAKTRFEDEEGRSGTNPEELIAAALASCFTMQAAFLLSNAGFAPTELRTNADLTLKPVDGKQTIVSIALVMEGNVPGANEEDFRRIANEAKAVCPVSRVLKAEITLDAKLQAQSN
jgi:lipoyl-dependent peroxiredoxin